VQNRVLHAHQQRQLDLAQRAHISDALRARKQPLTPEELAPLCITMQDFERAVSKVQPASKREGYDFPYRYWFVQPTFHRSCVLLSICRDRFASTPDVTWADIGALEQLQAELDLVILQPIVNPTAFESIGITVPV
jgi:ribosome biogenesis ATPase